MRYLKHLKRKQVIITLLILVETITLFLTFMAINNRNNKLLDGVNIKNELVDGIAIMIQNKDKQGYTKSTSSIFPTDLVLNEEKSGCMDSKGKKIENSVLIENDNIKVRVKGKASCYLYFDRIDPVEFAYTGNYQTYTAPVSGYYFIETYGASGGDATYNVKYNGGKGAYVSGNIYLNRNDVIYLYVGGEGSSHSGTTTDTKSDNGKGYNGGSEGLFSSGNHNAGGGGGATDIRYFGSYVPTEEELIWNSNIGLNSRIMVSGGGGGAASHKESPNYSGQGGAGAYLIGGNAQAKGNYYSYGMGGRQDRGGQAKAMEGTTGDTVTSSGFGYGGNQELAGGGGGYYGGGDGYHAPAGGGSSFISGYAGVNAIANSNDTENPRTHTNNVMHYSGKYFLNGEMKSGNNEGNGKAKISFSGKTLKKLDDNLDNVRYIKDCIDDNSNYRGDHWVELQAIKDGINVAYQKNIVNPTSEVSEYQGKKTYDVITDGDIWAGNYAEAGEYGAQCITIDLEDTYDLDEVAVWHYYGDNRSYNNHSLYVSNDNITWRAIIDDQSGVSESSNGIRYQTKYSNENVMYINSGGHDIITTYDELAIKLIIQDKASKEYCIKEENTSESCTWKEITKEIIHENYILTKEGDNTIYAFIKDDEGNISSLQKSIKLDNTAPELEVASGAMMYEDPEFAEGSNGINVYTNSGYSGVSIERKEISGIPNSSGYGLEIITSENTSPGLGGFAFRTTSEANKIYTSVILAKIPVGYTLKFITNSTGDGSSTKWLTSAEGTGDWEYYIVQRICGSTGTFKTTNYYYLDGGSAPVTWQIAYATVFDTTKEEAESYIISVAKENIMYVDGYKFVNGTANPDSYDRLSFEKEWVKIEKVISNGTYSVWYKNNLDVETGKNITVSNIDSTAPTGSITIAGGATYATSRSVTLSLSGSDNVGVKEMCISNTTSCSSWETYATSKSWTLTDGDVSKTVYVWYRDTAGNVSSRYSDSITLDTTAPTVKDVSINSGATYTTSASMSVNITWDNTDVAQYCVVGSNSSSQCTWKTASGNSVTVTYSHTSTNGTKTVYAFLKDNAGNISGSKSDTIIFDNTRPSVSYNVSGGTYNTAKSVTITASDSGGSGYNYMNVSVYKNGTRISAQKITTTTNTVSLDSPGTFIIYTQVFDKAGNRQSKSPESSDGYYYQQYTINLPFGQYLLKYPTSGLNTSSQAGLYRYQGSNVNNYVCFGTTTKSTCTGNTDAYMYRIIGIDSSGKVKLIKKEALNSATTWYTSSGADWTGSTVRSFILGNAYFTNSTYMPSGWADKIALVNWKYGNVDVESQPAINLYNTENGWTATSSSKIALMYNHDYSYSYQSGGYDCFSSSSSVCKSSWMHLSNNDSSSPSSAEWTMTRYQEGKRAWRIGASGGLDWVLTTNPFSVRPVFFLNSSVIYISGSGTSSDPFIIS